MPHRIGNHNLQENFYFHLFPFVSSVFCKLETSFFCHCPHRLPLKICFCFASYARAVRFNLQSGSKLCMYNILTALTPFSSEFKQKLGMSIQGEKNNNRMKNTRTRTPTTWLWWCTMTTTTTNNNSPEHIKVLGVCVSLFFFPLRLPENLCWLLFSAFGYFLSLYISTVRARTYVCARQANNSAISIWFWIGNGIAIDNKKKYI